MKKTLTIAFSLLFGYLGMSQVEIREVVSPAPTAASLAKYADVPVGYYTGTPSISIPLYTVQDRDITLPISLSYNASGIKVSEEASWVGLGWSLNAGGVITRVVRGLDDFQEQVNKKGYPFSELPERSGIGPIQAQDNLETIWTYIREYNGVFQDPEPDIFYYNFGTKSGTFYLQKTVANSNILLGVTQKKEDLHIEYNKGSKYWTIIDTNGDVYTFNEYEITESGSTSGTSRPNELSFQVPLPDLDNPVLSSWYLEKIESRAGGLVEFEYDPGFRATSQLQISEKALRAYNILGQNCGSMGFCGFEPSGPQLQQSYFEYTASRSYRYLKYLKEISFPGGKLTFRKSPRLDLIPTLGDLQPEAHPQKLDAIDIYQTGNSQPIKSFQLKNDYFKRSENDTDSRYLRLKLKEVVEVGSDLETISPYVFDYEEEVPIPSKLTFDYDHWGYYNGKRNDVLSVPWSSSKSIRGTAIPSVQFLNTTNGNYNDLKGANREPDLDFAKLFSLKQITYPTSGVHDFQFELNEYGNLDRPYIISIEDNVVADTVLCNQSSLSACDNAASGINLSFEVGSETLDDGTVVGKDIYIEYFFIGGPITPGTYSGPFLEITNVSEGGSPFFRTFEDLSVITQGEGTTIYAEPGEHLLWVNLPVGVALDVRVVIKDKVKVPVTKKKGAGLRLQKLTIQESPTSEPIIKKYLYTSNGDGESSSGILMGKPDYFSSLGLTETLVDQYGICVSSCSGGYEYIHGSSVSQNNLGASANGKYIGYSEVVEVHGENGENGRINYFFYNAADETDQWSTGIKYVSGVPSYPHLENGLLSGIETYDSNGIIQKKQEYNYVIDGPTKLNIPAFYVRTPNTYGAIIDKPIEQIQIQYQFYDIPVQWWKLDHEIITNYNVNGTPNVVIRTDYERYNAINILPEKTSTVDSDGRVIVNEKFYSLNYGGDSFGSNHLRLEHMNSQVLKEKITVDNIPVSASTSSYELIGDDGDGVQKVLPTTQTYLPKDSEQGKVEIAYQYYEDGNVLAANRTNGTSVVYLWGYDDKYPIAKIENASPAQVATALGIEEAALGGINETNLSQIDALRTADAFKERMVTTYEYSPLIGVTSMKDPKGYQMNYLYDSFNRLKEVRDQDNNLLSDYEYKYKDPVRN